MKNKATGDVYVQLDVFSMFSKMESLFEEPAETELANSDISFVLENKDDYLEKGNRLISLAREVFHRQIKNFELSGIEEQIYSIKMDKSDSLLDIISKISKKVTRPILKSMGSPDDIQEFLSNINSRFDVKIYIPEAPVCSFRYILGKKASRVSSDEKILLLTLKEEGYEPFEMYGLKNSSHPANRKNTLFRNGICVADIADVLSFLFVLTEILKVFDTDSSFHETDLLFNRFFDVQKDYRNNKGDSDISECHKLSEHKFLYPGDRPSLNYRFMPVVEHYLKRIGAKFDVVPFNSIRHDIDVAKKAGRTKTWPVLIRKSLGSSLYTMYFMEIRDISYHDFVYTNSSNYWPFFCKKSGFSDLHPLFAKLFHIIWEEKAIQAKTTKYWKSLDSDYAKSYQKKKNIPDKVVSAMANSLLNHYFGFVEFDELVDISKMEQIAREFVAVKETYFSYIDSSQNAIRFRRLGNHHAAGLYYPAVKCLCVDIKYPHSLIHEYGHLIDYEYGRLSHEFAFYHIRKLYEQHLSRLSVEDSVVSEKLNGKTKYNLSYYQEPTEIFARSFELYVSKCLGVKNSLLPLDFGWEYPCDEKFIEAVKFYFDNIFANIAIQKSLAA